MLCAIEGRGAARFARFSRHGLGKLATLQSPKGKITVPNHGLRNSSRATPYSHSCEVKQRLAKRLGEIYARQMGTNANRITIAIRELGEGGVWRCGEGEPRPAALLMCDIRRGRPAQQRAELAARLVEACTEILGLGRDNLNVEFTQHAGDEMYHPLLGGLSDDWIAAEGNVTS
jgi:phenylpyruvate tautomerase PptA (4-oxalocrotonate tautomerase family)